MSAVKVMVSDEGMHIGGAFTIHLPISCYGHDHEGLQHHDQYPIILRLTA